MLTNLIAVQWGLLSLFGILVTLLIPRADQHYDAFRRHGSDAEHKAALRWSQLVRWLPLGMIIPIALLSWRGARDAGVIFLTRRPSTDSWLLITPILAQLAVTYFARRMSHHIRKSICAERRPCNQERVLRSRRFDRPTLIRFINEQREEVHIYWLNYDGNRQGLGPNDTPIVVEAMTEKLQQTFVTHPFVVTDRNDRCIGIFEPMRLPSKAIIRDSEDPQCEDDGLRRCREIAKEAMRDRYQRITRRRRGTNTAS
jgi:hypothetical protein